MKLILDASSIIAMYGHLDCSQAITMLKDLGYETYMPKAVHEELKGGPTYSKAREVILREIMVMEHPPLRELDELRRKYPALGPGELEVIYWASYLQKQGESVFAVLDDKKARTTAQRLRLKIKGTLGLLNLLKNHGLIDEAKKRNTLNQLKEAGFRVAI